MRMESFGTSLPAPVQAEVARPTPQAASKSQGPKAAQSSVRSASTWCSSRSAVDAGTAAPPKQTTTLSLRLTRPRVALPLSALVTAREHVLSDQAGQGHRTPNKIQKSRVVLCQPDHVYITKLMRQAQT